MLFSKKKKEKKKESLKLFTSKFTILSFTIHKILCRDFALSVSLCSFIYFILI